jgi:hypothetical protein
MRSQLNAGVGVQSAAPVWHPKARPEWVTHLNEMGRSPGDPAAIVPLDEASLLAAAVEATGLEDWGGLEWRDPFRLLLSDLNTVADLNLVGRLMARAEIVRSLIARLRIAKAYKDFPQIESEKIEEPVIIAGWGRSGTSILHELFAVDPYWRVPLTWELLYPAPPPEAATRADDPRIALAEADQTFWNRITPEWKTIHDNRALEPNEDHTGTVHEFVSPTWTGPHQVPNYEAWYWLEADQGQLYRFHRRLLKVLQLRAPGRWLLKGPAHTMTLPALFAEYPDARIVTLHRDPLKVMPSLVSMTATLRWQRSDNVDYDAVLNAMAHVHPLALHNMIEQRDGGVVPNDRFFDINYRDLMADATGTIGQVYDWLGVPFTDEVRDGIAAYLANRPKGKHGAHEYTFDDLGLDKDTVRAGFQTYIDRFNVPAEV